MIHAGRVVECHSITIVPSLMSLPLRVFQSFALSDNLTPSSLKLPMKTYSTWMLTPPSVILLLWSSFCDPHLSYHPSSYCSLSRCQKASRSPVPRCKGSSAPWVHHCGTSICVECILFYLSHHFQLVNESYFRVLVCHLFVLVMFFLLLHFYFLFYPFLLVWY